MLFDFSLVDGVPHAVVAMRALGCYRDRGSRGRILNAQARNRTAFDIFHRLFKIPLRPSNNAVVSILAHISDYEKYQFIEKRERPTSNRG